VIEDKDGERKVLRGRGAGRYATTEAVIADLFDIRHALNDSLTSKFVEAAL
jgi:homoserine dehydrogenase